MKYLFSILLIILCVSCNNSDLKTIENENFSISYPESLNREESGENNTLFKLTPINPDENRNYIESINLVTRDYPNMSLKQAAQKLKKEVNLKTYPFSDSSKLHNFSFFIGSRPNENSL